MPQSLSHIVAHTAGNPQCLKVTYIVCLFQQITRTRPLSAPKGAVDPGIGPRKSDEAEPVHGNRNGRGVMGYTFTTFIKSEETVNK